jgi:hypothetical protein
LQIICVHVPEASGAAATRVTRSMRTTRASSNAARAAILS